MELCKTIRMHFENGEVRETLISREISDEMIERMGINQYFDLSYANGKTESQKCIKVEIDPKF